MRNPILFISFFKLYKIINLCNFRYIRSIRNRYGFLALDYKRLGTAVNANFYGFIDIQVVSIFDFRHLILPRDSKL